MPGSAIRRKTTVRTAHRADPRWKTPRSTAVRLAQGTQLTNKYAEGYPGKRPLRRLRVRGHRGTAGDRPPPSELFGAEAANAQPNSGSQANQGVYIAALCRAIRSSA